MMKKTLLFITALFVSSAFATPESREKTTKTLLKMCQLHFITI